MTKDHQLLLLGAVGLVGSFFIGKATIDGIAAARARKEAGETEPEYKRSKMDDVVRFGGVVLSLYTMFEQAPEWLEKANQLLGE